jgi:hypothetical protein
MPLSVQVILMQASKNCYTDAVLLIPTTEINSQQTIRPILFTQIPRGSMYQTQKLLI